ncbi:MAG: hypothetical protein ABSG52_03460 [Terriglobales bacterium]|jgi:hypothetical protein
MPITPKEELRLIEQARVMTLEIERLKAVEKELREQNHLSQLVYEAEQENPGRVILHPNSIGYEIRPPETRMFSERAIEKVVARKQREAAAAERERVQLEQARAFELKKQTELQIERERIAKNVKDYGHLRVPNMEAFNRLNDELKAKQFAMFGVGFVQLLHEKVDSQLSWEAFDELRTIEATPRKSAKAEASNDAAAD